MKPVGGSRNRQRRGWDANITLMMSITEIRRAFNVEKENISIRVVKWLERSSRNQNVTGQIPATANVPILAEDTEPLTCSRGAANI